MSVTSEFTQSDVRLDTDILHEKAYIKWLARILVPGKFDVVPSNPVEMAESKLSPYELKVVETKSKHTVIHVSWDFPDIKKQRGLSLVSADDTNPEEYYDRDKVINQQKFSRNELSPAGLIQVKWRFLEMLKEAHRLIETVRSHAGNLLPGFYSTTTVYTRNKTFPSGRTKVSTIYPTSNGGICLKHYKGMMLNISGASN